jgi:hypothetical protein
MDTFTQYVDTLKAAQATKDAVEAARKEREQREWTNTLIANMRIVLGDETTDALVADSAIGVGQGGELEVADGIFFFLNDMCAKGFMIKRRLPVDLRKPGQDDYLYSHQNGHSRAWVNKPDDILPILTYTDAEIARQRAAKAKRHANIMTPWLQSIHNIMVEVLDTIQRGEPTTTTQDRILSAVAFGAKIAYEREDLYQDYDDDDDDDDDIYSSEDAF